MTGRPFFERRDWEEEIESQIEKMSRISSSLKISVTRSGKISPLWQNFKSIRLFFEGLFCIGNGFEHNWANFYEIGQIFIVVDGPILKRLFRHLVTLLKIPLQPNFLSFLIISVRHLAQRTLRLLLHFLPFEIVIRVVESSLSEAAATTTTTTTTAAHPEINVIKYIFCNNSLETIGQEVLFLTTKILCLLIFSANLVFTRYR